MLDEGQTYQYDLNSNWSQPLYTCASSMKASVRTVTFSSNATNSSADLGALSVVKVEPKAYSQDELPTWAIERADGYTVGNVELFWGLANASLINETAFHKIQAAEIYLPHATHGITNGHLYDSFAAGMAFSAAWNDVYQNSAAVRGVAIDFIPRYD